jgi:hypothetical protein
MSTLPPTISKLISRARRFGAAAASTSSPMGCNMQKCKLDTSYKPDCLNYCAIESRVNYIEQRKWIAGLAADRCNSRRRTGGFCVIGERNLHSHVQIGL